MATYTADSVSLLSYLVDALPQRADRIFSEAEAGETVIQAPSTALAEVLYSVSRDKDVRGVTLTGTPADAQRGLVDNGPISTVPIDDNELTTYARTVGEFTIHDALVVASHTVRDTEAIITTDEAIADAGYETVWACG